MRATLTALAVTGSLLAAAAPAAAASAPAATPAPPAPAAAARQAVPGTPVEVRLDPDAPAPVAVPAPRGSARVAPVAPATGAVRVDGAASDWEVTYSGFTAPAQAAFQRAVARWAALVPSSQVIHVEATYAPLPSAAAPDAGLLGSAGPTELWEELDRPDHLAAVALLEAAEGGPVNEPGAPDISAEFNSAQSAWWFDAAAPPSSMIDFETVVLHELGHGLGFLGTAGYEGSGLAIGFPVEGGRYVTAWDDLVARVDGGTATRVRSLGDTGPAVAAALTSERLAWDGPQGVLRNDGVRPVLYAPPAFEEGSSYSHLDEDAYPKGSRDGLMTPYLSAGERLTFPGPIALGVLQDLGWPAPTRFSTTVPAAPTGAAATAADASAVVTWTPPATAGSSGVTGYTATASPSGATCTTTGATTCTLTGLVNGAAQTVTVQARNANGASAASAPSAPVTPVAVPGAPTGVTAVRGDGTLAVSWAAPLSTGGSPVTGYTATAAPGGATCSTAGETACTLTGLANGTAYTVVVRAANANGTGPASAPSPAATPATLPGAPTAVTAVPGDRRLTASWTAPASTGGAPVTGYTATAVPGGATCATTGATRCTLTGLENGTAYEVVVTATNAVGTGAVSAPSAPAVPAVPVTAGPPARDPGVLRLSGHDRFATAVAVSQGSFPGTAQDVVLVTGEDWPDALSAGPAAAHLDAPVLLTRRDALPAAVLAEVDRLAPARVWVVGGTGVVQEPVLQQLRARGLEVTRVSGPDRYATAAAVAERFFVDPAGAYYASGATYVDALAGGAAAAARDWPLLLTAPGAKPAATPLLGVDRVVLGGTAAVSEAVRVALDARRVSGVDRYATAAAIATDAFDEAAVAYLATGANFPDALAAAPAAGRDRAPLLLTPRDCTTPATRAALTSLGAVTRVVLGGTGAVSDAAAQLTAC